MKNKDCLIKIIKYVSLFSFLYFVVKYFEGDPNTLVSEFDNNLPFISQFVYFYILWYPMLIVVPFIVSLYDKEIFNRYLKVYAIAVLCSLLIFLIYPTTIIRGDIIVNNISTYIVSLVYYFDNPVLNCFPSIHVVGCVLFIISMLEVKNVPYLFKGSITILSILTILSTLFLKQHVIYDVIISIVMVSVIWIAIKIIYKNKKR